MNENSPQIFKAWGIPTRLFHWINFLCVFLLSILGLIMLYKGDIGITSPEARINLKILHVIVGYVFSINLLIRIVRGVFGEQRSRWSVILPGKRFKQELGDYRQSAASGKPQTFIGHNPPARLSIVVLFVVMITMMVTGLIRAGTDIYFPPFGSMAASFVAAKGVDPSQIKPYDKEGTNADKMDELRAFRMPFGDIHLYSAFFLWFWIVLHIGGCIRADARGEGTIISAMFSGKKHLPRPPEDL